MQAQNVQADLAQEGLVTGRISRRSFLSSVTIAWTAFAAAVMMVSTAVTRSMFPNVLFEPPQTFEAVYPNEIQIGEVDEQFKDKERVWLVRDQGGIYALSAICTHLGCTPNWLQEEQKFKCPCHGSGYYKRWHQF